MDCEKNHIDLKVPIPSLSSCSVIPFDKSEGFGQSEQDSMKIPYVIKIYAGYP